jgi:hypothetical protein
VLLVTMGMDIETAIERFAQEAPHSWFMFASHPQVQATPLTHWMGGRPHAIPHRSRQDR